LAAGGGDERSIRMGPGPLKPVDPLAWGEYTSRPTRP